LVRRIGFFCLALAVLAVGPLARSFASHPAARIEFPALPLLAGCETMHGWNAGWSPQFVGPDLAISDTYQCDGYRLHVSVVQYVEQRQGKEAVGEFNAIIPRSWWNITTRAQRNATTDLEVSEYRVDGTPQLTIWNWYAVGVQPSSSELRTKAIEGLNALRFRARATTNITVAVEADPTFDATGPLRTNVPRIWAWFVSQMGSAG